MRSLTSVSAGTLLILMLILGSVMPLHAQDRSGNAAAHLQGTSEATVARQDCPQFPAGIEVTAAPTAEATSAATAEPTAAVPGYLGISAVDSFDGCGAIVDAVDPQGPAQAAGLQVDDLVWGVDRTLVRDRDALRTAIVRLPPGTSVTLWVQRGSETLQLKVNLGTRPVTVEPTIEPPGAATSEATPAQ